MAISDVTSSGAAQTDVAKAAGSDYDQLFGDLMNQLGYTKDPTGKIVADPNNPATQIRNMNQQRLLASFQGTAPNDPTLERSLAEQEHQLRASLQSNLGPGYETSSAGIAALGEARRNAAMARFSANQNVMNTANTMNQENVGNISGAGTSRTSSAGTIAGIYGGAANTYSQAQQLALQQQQIEQSGRNALFSGIGQLAGAGAGAYATYAALA